MSIGLNKVIRSEHFQSYTGPRSPMAKFNGWTCKYLPLRRGEVGIFFQAAAVHDHQVRYSAVKGVCLALQLTVGAISAALLPIQLLSIHHSLGPCFFVLISVSRQALPISAGLAEPLPSLAILSLHRTRAPHSCLWAT